MLDYFKKLLSGSKDEMTAEVLFVDDDIELICNCADCKIGYCQDITNYDFRCEYIVDIPNFSKLKDSILIIDDNKGMVSFLEDDIEFLSHKKIIDRSNLNIISMSSNLAAFNFEVTQRKMKGLNIKYAIIDITLGGSVMTPKGNIKYTGVDVYEMILEYNPEIKFVFYTGNNLNPYINANKKLIEQFHNLTNKNIRDFVLFKTSLDMDTRRKHLAKCLFNKKI